jgi:hypothetical protein
MIAEPSATAPVPAKRESTSTAAAALSTRPPRRPAPPPLVTSLAAGRAAGSQVCSMFAATDITEPNTKPAPGHQPSTSGRRAGDEWPGGLASAGVLDRQLRQGLAHGVIGHTRSAARVSAGQVPVDRPLGQRGLRCASGQRADRCSRWSPCRRLSQVVQFDWLGIDKTAHAGAVSMADDSSTICGPGNSRWLTS